WHFRDGEWQETSTLLTGLELRGEPVLTSRNGLDSGFRFRDVTGNGVCEVIISNPDQNGILAWSDEAGEWRRLDFALPGEVSMVDATGRDHGLRFVDLNSDGFEDLVFSNDREWSVHLFIATAKDW